VAALAVVATVGVGYASSGARPPADLAVRQFTPNFSSINKENSHFLNVPRAGHHVVVGEAPRRIHIPAINLNAPIIQTQLVDGTTWQVADWAVGDMVGSPNPGTCTVWAGFHDCTTALSGHDDIKGELFRRNIDLQVGDKVYITTKNTVFTYTVNGKYVVAPYDSSNLFSGTKSIALVSCTPYWVDTSRLIVTARLTYERSRRG